MCGFKCAIAPLGIQWLGIRNRLIRIGQSIALWLIERPQLASQNSYVRGRFEPQRHTVAGHAAYDYGNPISDDDFLAYFAAENQHDPGPP
jgi:hypothetical protein